MHYRVAEEETRQLQLSEFFQSVEKRAYRMAEMETRNRDDALELVQESMLKLVQSYRMRPSHEWKPLFYRILQNCIMDFHRKRQRQKVFFAWSFGKDDETDVDLGDLDPVQMGPDDEAIRSMTMEKLDQALGSLSTRQRQAFLLRLWEGFDVAATAKVMRCSAGSVKTHLSRALQQLRKALEDV